MQSLDRQSYGQNTAPALGLTKSLAFNSFSLHGAVSDWHLAGQLSISSCVLLWFEALIPSLVSC